MPRSRRAEAKGEIEALLAKYHAYQRAPEITRQRLYLEAMQELLQGVKNKTIIDADLKHLLPLLNLDSTQGSTQPMNRRHRRSSGRAGSGADVPLAESVLYTVNERELAVLLQFGEPVASRTKPGLYFKLPLIQEVMRLPKTLQVWHGTNQAERLVDVPTADGKKVEVTVWAVWRITDPAQFVQTLRTVSNAESRVKEFVRSTARDTITTHKLAEIVRSTNRKMTYTLGLPPEIVATAGAAAKKGARV